MNNDQRVYAGFMLMVECYRRIKLGVRKREERKGKRDVDGERCDR